MFLRQRKELSRKLAKSVAIDAGLVKDGERQQRVIGTLSARSSMLDQQRAAARRSLALSSWVASE